MTNPVTSDKLSTHLGVKERNLDAAGGDRKATGMRQDMALEAPERANQADIGVASERLAQQRADIDNGRIRSAQQARAQLAQLQIDVARDPRGVLGAFARLSPEGVTAAIAEPSG